MGRDTPARSASSLICTPSMPTSASKRPASASRLFLRSSAGSRLAAARSVTIDTSYINCLHSVNMQAASLAQGLTARLSALNDLAALPGSAGPRELFAMRKDPLAFLHTRFEAHGRV